MPARTAFATKLRARTPLIGTFVKLRDPSVIEMLGLCGFDFVVIDAEHAPFDRQALAIAVLAARAAGVAALVRVPEADGTWISAALDCGAAGILAPQVASAAMAEYLVRRVSYGSERGFSPSTAAAGYGTRGIENHLQSQPGETVLICQIEDRSAVALAAEIAAVTGVDGLLVGPVDLAVSEGLTNPSDPAIEALGVQVISAARSAGIAGGMFISDPAAITRWTACGASLFVLGSDQSFLMQSAQAGVAAARQRLSGGNS
ncbi:MAG: aldolase/citrate lyase family protein [Hoeflea sp.]|uniref:HpcH/HpaI aldolase family protein n=1 Tax=Hoeflea sp. TaxID=1940281 RepID=UPI0032996DA1|tara:strand:- start:392 stop:1171 length:780 start_codon:yes stop_codon:yes gene_type:complete